jgi:iron complex transport system substrate-binding protein
MRVLLLLFSLLGVLWAEGNTSRLLIDMAQRHVELPQKIEGIVTVGGTPAINSFIFLFDKADIIQNGVQSPLSKMPFWKHQKWFFDDLFRRPQVSSNPPEWTANFEKLAMTHFDVALVNNALSAELLEKRGYKAAVVNWHGDQSILRSVDFLAQLFNMPERALEYRRYTNTTHIRIAKALSPFEGERRSALYLRLGMLNLPMVSTANTMIKAAGGQPSAASIAKEHATISLEKLYAWNPDVLFVWSKQDVKLAYSDLKYANLKAVKNKEVYVVPMGAHFWTHYTPEQPLGILWMATKLYPKRFMDIDMRKEVFDFYSRFMQRQLSSEQINEILVNASF